VCGFLLLSLTLLAQVRNQVSTKKGANETNPPSINEHITEAENTLFHDVISQQPITGMVSLLFCKYCRECGNVNIVDL
jgi:hypothetical protein